MQSVLTSTRPIPVAPGRTPGIGHAISLLNRPLEFLRSLLEVGALVQVDIGSLPMIVVTDASLTKQVLTEQQDF